MNYITTTDLRTKSSDLLQALKKGLSVSLIHRSKIVGTISPITPVPSPPIQSDALKMFLKEIGPKYSVNKKRRTSLYGDHLRKRYGKDIS